jgi:hypothetical protein
MDSDSVNLGSNQTRREWRNCRIDNQDQYKAVAETALERAKAILSAVNKQEEAE